MCIRDRGLERHGGAIRYKARVTEVLIENDQAVGVKLGVGEVIRAKRVISNATAGTPSPERVMSSAAPARPWWMPNTRRAKNSSGASVMCLPLRSFRCIWGFGLT